MATAPDGAFVVVWSSGPDANNTNIQGQRYLSNGSAQGPEFQVNSYTTGGQSLPSVAAAADGSFVVTWQSYGSSGTDTNGYSIQAQRYASGGTILGGEFQVNTYTTSTQSEPSVAAAGGEFVVAWRSLGSPGTDTSNESIQGRRYILAAPSAFVSHIFQILGTSNAVQWSWRIDTAGGVTVASAINVGPVTNGGGPDLFATEFINSINLQLQQLRVSRAYHLELGQVRAQLPVRLPVLRQRRAGDRH